MFELPKLSYSYDALEPYIDAQTMEIHYEKHHGGYTTKLNAALANSPKLQNMAIEEILMDIEQVPNDSRQAVINNGGGFANHKLFWEIMSPNGKALKKSKLEDSIIKRFESFENFKSEFSQVASARFGSGWTWLVLTPENELDIFSTPNQDSPIMGGDTPILGLDVWEHAYYLKYQNRRPDYIEAWWNVVNWEKVSELYEKYTS